ncbi:hypothetical protein [Cerasicoccus fimbriatus]|uniref:hypothetical protein n=1 Tax=Cerasicoccus fimbriatus TaxID=3014554 RepID=UPI0022B3CEBA|nr:hypothetical protein [Cerasicoccus sp. TK19100]
MGIESKAIRLAMLSQGIETNAELAQLCLMAPQTMNRVICGANKSPIARRRVQNALGAQFWENIPLDVNPDGTPKS